jgi:hypothetical protein
MPVMNQSERTAIGALFQSDVSQAREGFGALVKADIHAAAAAVDDWIVANTASFNAALPTAFRTTATPAQKTRLFVAVLTRRHQTGA